MALRPLNEVAASVRAAGHGWTARENPVTQRLAATADAEYDEQLRRLLGARVDQAAVAALQSEAPALAAPDAAALPAAFDWRNANGHNWITPIRDQQSCGACVSFATCAVLESRLRIAGNNPNLDVDLAEADLFFCGGGTCAAGWFIPSAVRRAQNPGVGVEAAFPYQPMDQPCPSGVAARVRVTACMTPTNMAARKAEIVARGPIIVSFNVFDDFFHYSSGVYRRTSNNLVGGHAVATVGYSDAEQCWICKNSWRSSWGDQGYFKIGYGECDIDSREPGYGPTVVSA